MAQSWFTLQPVSLTEGSRPAIFEAFDSLQVRVKQGFDYTSDAVVAAIFGIAGAVDSYEDLPDPTELAEKTIYIVREEVGSPDGNGLYWIKELAGVNTWVFLDALNLQKALEVPYDNANSGLDADNVQSAIDTVTVIANGKANLESPSFTGTPSAPTAVTGTDTTQIATTAFVNASVTSGISGHTQPFSTITETPTTVAGYGITDAVLNTDSRLSDARTPVAHDQASSTISDSTTAGRALLTATDTTAQVSLLGAPLNSVIYAAMLTFRR